MRVYSHTRTMFQMMLQGCLKLTQVRKFKVKGSSQTLFPTSSFLAFGKWRFYVAAVSLVFDLLRMFSDHSEDASQNFM